MPRNFAVLNSRIFIARIPRCLFTFRLKRKTKFSRLLSSEKAPPRASTFLEFSPSGISEYHSGILLRIRAYNWKGIPLRFPFALALEIWMRHTGSVNEKSWSLRTTFYSRSFLLRLHSPECLQYVLCSTTREFYSAGAGFTRAR